MWLVRYSLEKDVKVTKPRVEIFCQGDGIAGMIDLGSLDQIDHSIIKHVEDGEGRLLVKGLIIEN